MAVLVLHWVTSSDNTVPKDYQLRQNSGLTFQTSVISTDTLGHTIARSDNATQGGGNEVSLVFDNTSGPESPCYSPGVRLQETEEENNEFNEPDDKFRAI
jgi:hypothetical protein